MHREMVPVGKAGALESNPDLNPTSITKRLGSPGQFTFLASLLRWLPGDNSPHPEGLFLDVPVR